MAVNSEGKACETGFRKKGERSPHHRLTDGDRSLKWGHLVLC
jgi:hypothetical protein